MWPITWHTLVGFGGFVSLVARFASMSDMGETDTLRQDGLRPVAPRQDLMPDRSRHSDPRALDLGRYQDGAGKTLVASRRAPGRSDHLNHGHRYVDMGLV